MATPRSLIVDPTRRGVYHCISRCVRRAFLCGRDSYSGRDYEHRRGWIRDRLRELVGRFAVEIHSYAAMSNHLHVVVRTLPERAEGWDDEEVARRWLWLFPGRGGKRGHPPAQDAIKSLCRDRSKLAICRQRLADLSWFMRCLNEDIARRANAEDECTGRFWEGRFKSQQLADEGASLACMAYVDLNPVRAGIAGTLEQSEFTSVQDRIVACRARCQLAALADRPAGRSLGEAGIPVPRGEDLPQNPTPEQQRLISKARAEAGRDAWLAPLGDAEVGTGHHPPPLVPGLTAERYLDLLDWTGREIRLGKRGHLRGELRPALERLDLDVEHWVENVERFGGLFHRVAGKLQQLREMARAVGQSWLQGHAGTRRLYAGAS